MMKQSILNGILWFMTVLYLVSLFLPYRVMYGGTVHISVLRFMFPLAGAVFIIPYMLLVYLSGTKTARIWNIVLASVLLFVCIVTFLISGLEIFAEAKSGIGAYLFLLVGIAFFVISLIQNKMPVSKENDSRVLDQLP